MLRLCALGSLLCAAVPASGQILADAVADFSGVQGQNGWYYGYYSGSFDTASFQQMAQFDGVRWYVDTARYWTMVGPVGTHPNGSITSPPPIATEQWSARRWVSDYAGTVQIDMVLRKLNLNPASNGIRGRLFVDGLEIYNQFILGTDGVGVNTTVSAPVVIGSTVDFVVDPVGGNDWSDGTRFTGVISIPGPAGVGMLGIAGMFAIRRRR